MLRYWRLRPSALLRAAKFYFQTLAAFMWAVCLNLIYLETLPARVSLGGMSETQKQIVFTT